MADLALSPFLMLYYLIIGLLVIPFKALKEPQHHSVLVVITLWQFDPFDFKEFPEILDMSLFALSQILSLEHKSLVISTWNDNKDVFKTWLILSDLVIYNTCRHLDSTLFWASLLLLCSSFNHDLYFNFDH